MHQTNGALEKQLARTSSANGRQFYQDLVRELPADFFQHLKSHLTILFTKKKTDVKTAWRSVRHAKSSTMLDHYAQTDMNELIAALEMMLGAIFSHAEGLVN